MMLLKMLWVFFKIGLFTIGGGYAMIPLITRDLVQNDWMTVAEVTDVIAIAKMTPGPFAVNTATFAGMKIYGVGGAIACTFGVILPSLIITMIVARFFFDFQKHKMVQGALKGIRPVVVALIAFAVWNVATLTLFSHGEANPSSLNALWKMVSSVDWRALVVLAVSMVLLFWKKAHPILVITVAGVLGIGLYHFLPMVV